MMTVTFPVCPLKPFATTPNHILLAASTLRRIRESDLNGYRVKPAESVSSVCQELSVGTCRLPEARCWLRRCSRLRCRGSR